jgi:hypothetical protein
MQSTPVDDLLTLAALGVIAFALADVSHEALGHGLATLIVGGKVDLLTTCFLNSSGHYSKWIPAAGGQGNNHQRDVREMLLSGGEFVRKPH